MEAKTISSVIAPGSASEAAGTPPRRRSAADMLMSNFRVAPEDLRIAQRPSGGTPSCFPGFCPRLGKRGSSDGRRFATDFSAHAGASQERSEPCSLIIWRVHDYRGTPATEEEGQGTLPTRCETTSLPSIAQLSGRSLGRRGESSDARTRADGDLRLRQRDRAGLRGQRQGFAFSDPSQRTSTPKHMQICTGSTILGRRFLRGAPATEEARRCWVL